MLFDSNDNVKLCKRRQEEAWWILGGHSDFCSTQMGCSMPGLHYTTTVNPQPWQWLRAGLNESLDEMIFRHGTNLAWMKMSDWLNSPSADSGSINQLCAYRHQRGSGTDATTVQAINNNIELNQVIQGEHICKFYWMNFDKMSAYKETLANIVCTISFVISATAGFCCNTNSQGEKNTRCVVVATNNLSCWVY